MPMITAIVIDVAERTAVLAFVRQYFGGTLAQRRITRQAAGVARQGLAVEHRELAVGAHRRLVGERRVLSDQFFELGGQQRGAEEEALVLVTA